MAAKKASKKKIMVEKREIFSNFSVNRIVELNFFDIDGSKAGTIGCSNKFYRLEKQVAKDGSNNIQIYTEYGPTGRVQAREWRFFGDDEALANKEIERIIKSKLKKGYVEVDVAQRALGSSEAKQIVKPVITSKSATTPKPSKFSLHIETQRLIATLMGSTNNFVTTTLKCPLGQLSNQQIDIGRDYLNQAKTIVNGKKKEDAKILDLTNKFYSAIPHNLGSGARGKMTELLLDSIDKINQKEYDLDTLLDAKDFSDTLNSSSVDSQYKSLDTTFEYINNYDGEFQWLNSLVQDTRAHNHKFLGKIVLLNAWKVTRKNEDKGFIKRVEYIASNRKSNRQVIPKQLNHLVPDRPGGNSDLFKKANVIPLFHGTRTQNITGILKKGMLIRPSGVVICGAMYGNALYKGFSSKSINYTSIKTSYWAKGNDSRAYLFVTDCALGDQLIARGSYPYTEKNIAPNNSVWAQGGKSGVINDEFMLYRTDQHNIKYLLEFTCK